MGKREEARPPSSANADVTKSEPTTKEASDTNHRVARPTEPLLSSTSGNDISYGSTTSRLEQADTATTRMSRTRSNPPAAA